MKDLITALACIGACTTIGMLIFVLVLLAQIFFEQIRDIRWSYKYRHRFEKEPKAKCYCYDCRNYIREQERCTKFTIYPGDTGFCYQATPREKDPDKTEVSR